VIVVALEDGVPYVYRIESGEKPNRVVIADFDIDIPDPEDERYMELQHPGGAVTNVFMYEAVVEPSTYMNTVLLSRVCYEFDLPQEQESI